MSMSPERTELSDFAELQTSTQLNILNRDDRNFSVQHQFLCTSTLVRYTHTVSTHGNVQLHSFINQMRKSTI